MLRPAPFEAAEQQIAARIRAIGTAMPHDEMADVAEQVDAERCIHLCGRCAPV